ncbi:zinc finger protein 345-like isoform X8 [Lytechinus variegatus]|uniref:zinc finger protein 345-like isoform X8 n=1 Tax=Lytechinus variegatus TaxID=7654 RepID=UPI001BB1A528|nr:zinc finger protein 345-like isoform X8 [Lytechinus variegatus]
MSTMMQESCLELSCQTIIGPQCLDNGITHNIETLEASGYQQNKNYGRCIKEERIDEGHTSSALGGNSGSSECEMTESTGTACSHCKKIDGTSIKEERIDEGDSALDGNSECEMIESTGTVCSHSSGSQQNKNYGRCIKEERKDEGDTALDGNGGSCKCEMTESSGTVCSHYKKLDGTSIKEERIDEGDTCSALGGNSGSCECEMTECTGTVRSHCKKIDGTSVKEERTDGGDSVPDGNNGSSECKMTISSGTVCSHYKKIDGTSIKVERIDEGDTALGGNNGSCECEMIESTGTVRSHCKKIDGTSVKEERTDGGDSVPDGNNGSSEPCGSRQNSGVRGEKALIGNSGSCECKMTESKGTECSHCKRIDGTSIKEERIDEGDSVPDGNNASSECEMIDSTETVFSHCKKKHEITDTSAKMLLQCFFCDCSFSEEKPLTKHLQTHVCVFNSDTFQCLYCKESFLSNADLVKHGRICSEKISEECNQSSIVYYKMDSDKIHSKNHVEEENDQTVTALCLIDHNCKQDSQSPTEGNPLGHSFESRLCNSIYKTESDLESRVHVQEMVTQPVNSCTETYECKYCGKKFIQRGHLSEHIKICLKETPCHCTHCGKRFNNKSNLKEHKSSHKGETSSLRILWQEIQQN